MRKLLIALCFCILLSGCSKPKDVTAVYCPECRKHVYNYDNDLIEKNSLDKKGFKSVKIWGIFQYKLPKREINCPICENFLNGWEYWGQNQGYKSFKLSYPAMSLLTKVDEKWEWVPMDMPMIKLNTETK